MWLTIAILKGVGVHELIVGDAFIATILLFETYGLATAGFTYLVSFCFKSAPTAQNVVIFLNVGGFDCSMPRFDSLMTLCCLPCAGDRHVLDHGVVCDESIGIHLSSQRVTAVCVQLTACLRHRIRPYPRKCERSGPLDRWLR